MVLERYRAGWGEALLPFARALHRLGVTPNVLTLASFVFAVLAAVAFAMADKTKPWLLVAGAAAVSVNAVLDGLDGRLARLQRSETKRGDFLDHAIDRYADVAILAGLTLSPLGDLRWGLFAIIGTFLTSYMATQAQAMGLSRNYGGWLGRADRLVILIAIPALSGLARVVGIDIPDTYRPILWMLVYFAIVGNITALQRFWRAWKDLGSDDAARKP